MHFVSYAFAIFFVIVFGFRLILYRRNQLFVFSLIISSLVFYGYDTPEHVILLIVVSILNFDIAKRLSRYSVTDINRHACLAIAVAINIGALFILKFFDVIRYLIAGVQEQDFVWLDPKGFTYIVPIGISFYFLQNFSYVLDIYLKKTEPLVKFSEFFLFVSFFPKVIAGPILNIRRFIDQLHQTKGLSTEDLFYGGYFLIQGYFFKMVLAESLSREVDVYFQPGHLSFDHPLISLMTMYLFTCQIFCDFFGYTQIARGVAKLLGFSLPSNIKYPYISGTFAQFWRRWNITLTEWGKINILQPMHWQGGDKKRLYLSMFFAMVLYGVWSGPKITFIIWGIWHGLFLVTERFLDIETLRLKSVIIRVAWYLVVQAAVCIGWMVFRCNNIDNVAYHVRNIFFGNYDIKMLRGHIWNYYFFAPMLFSGIVVIVHLRALFAQMTRFRVTFIERSTMAGIMLYFIFTCYGKVTNFVFFRF
ncbi:MAG: MBOAT family protein [Oligoflexales bacterium]|nr:MBOAT family protein [Oligoflexales bacterium]